MHPPQHLMLALKNREGTPARRTLTVVVNSHLRTRRRPQRHYTQVFRWIIYPGSIAKHRTRLRLPVRADTDSILWAMSFIIQSRRVRNGSLKSEKIAEMMTQSSWKPIADPRIGISGTGIACFIVDCRSLVRLTIHSVSLGTILNDTWHGFWIVASLLMHDASGSFCLFIRSSVGYWIRESRPLFTRMARLIAFRRFEGPSFYHGHSCE